MSNQYGVISWLKSLDVGIASILLRRKKNCLPLCGLLDFHRQGVAKLGRFF